MADPNGNVSQNPAVNKFPHITAQTIVGVLLGALGFLVTHGVISQAQESVASQVVATVVPVLAPIVAAWIAQRYSFSRKSVARLFGTTAAITGSLDHLTVQEQQTAAKVGVTSVGLPAAVDEKVAAAETVPKPAPVAPQGVNASGIPLPPAMPGA